MRGVALLFLLCLMLCVQNLKASEAKWFEVWGDIFQFLPAAAGAYTLVKKDYAGLGQLALGTGITLAITFATKYTFVGISKANPNAASISQRPNEGSYDGFPSGHTASAFSAAGFMQRRYGWKWGVPTTILATSVAVSRVVAQRHTILQVIIGAVLGYGVSFLFAKNLNPYIQFDINIDMQEIAYNQYQDIYRIGFSYQF